MLDGLLRSRRNTTDVLALPQGYHYTLTGFAVCTSVVHALAASGSLLLTTRPNKKAT